MIKKRKKEEVALNRFDAEMGRPRFQDGDSHNREHNREDKSGIENDESDPVKMYLKDIGSTQLLDMEEEKALAKKMEASRNQVLL